MKALGVYLLVWYIISLFTSCLEYEYNYVSLIAFYFRQLSNIATIIFLGFTINSKKINTNILVLGLLLIVWFINVIPIDASGIYPIIPTIFFVIIDVATYIYISLYLMATQIRWYDIREYIRDVSTSCRCIIAW